jgi:hypothetical protein
MEKLRKLKTIELQLQHRHTPAKSAAITPVSLTVVALWSALE